MKILVISDTHGRDKELDRVMELEKPFDLLIHCGDVEGREDYIEAMAECPCHIVAGNNDFFSDLPGEEQVRINGKRYLVTHGHSFGVSRGPEELMDYARIRGFDGVFYGHTHKPVFMRKNCLLVINPGSLSYPRQQGREPSYCVLYTKGYELEGGIRFLSE